MSSRSLAEYLSPRRCTSTWRTATPPGCRVRSISAAKRSARSRPPGRRAAGPGRGRCRRRRRPRPSDGDPLLLLRRRRGPPYGGGPGSCSTGGLVPCDGGGGPARPCGGGADGGSAPWSSGGAGGIWSMNLRGSSLNRGFGTLIGTVGSTH